MEQKLDLILQKLGTIDTDIKGMKSDIAELKSDVAELKSDVAVLKDDVAELKTDVKLLKTRVDVLESNQLTFLHELREQRLEAQARERLFLKEFDDIRTSIRYVNRRVSDMELDVLSLKQKTGSPLEL